MIHPLILMVGGFLGSGKTTLLLSAARRLQQAGVRVALITNDQGGELVDTRLASLSGIDTNEIAGGCFCCRFSEFLRSAEALASIEPEVILAEPVGSCMDIAATILFPLRDLYGDRFRLAPYTVLVDPQRCEELLSTDADQTVAYLFRHQLEEADILCLSKADLAAGMPALPRTVDFRLSCQTGEGVAEWMSEVLEGTRLPGTHLLDIDYAEYAAAEAALGWLNWTADLRLQHALSPAAVIGPLLDDLDRMLTEAGAAIAHLKVFDQSPAGYLKASICSNGEEPAPQGDLAASPSTRHSLILNLRARAHPEQLRTIVSAAAARLPGRLTIRHEQAFQPAPPKPEHRSLRT